MIAVKARFDGKVLVPDGPLPLAPNQEVRITVEPIAPEPAARIDLGKQPGAMTGFTPDWEAPLPDEVWGFEEDE